MPWEKCDPSNSLFMNCYISMSISMSIMPWKKCNFSNSIFQNIHFHDFRIEESIFERTKFINCGVFNTFYLSNILMRNAFFENFRSQADRFPVRINNFSDLTGSIFRHLALRNVFFDDVNMQNCRIFNVTLQKSAIFNRVNMLATDFQYIDDLDKVSIIDSILPNSSFQTSFKYGTNLLINGDAEQGCDQLSMNKPIPHWYGRGTVQMFYDLTNLDCSNNDNCGYCLFFGGKRHNSLFPNSIEQTINVSHLTHLFYSNQTKFVFSALLGGINSAEDEVEADILFLNRTSIIHKNTLSKILNLYFF